MIRFGAAALASSLVAAVVAHGEKLLLVRLAPLAELAYYAIAFSVASTLLVVPTALAQAALPAFARQDGGDRSESQVYDRLVRANLLWLLPAACTLAVAIQPFLYYWVGANYASHSAVAFRILLIGFVANGLAQIPYQALVGAARTDLIAYIFAAEVIPALVLAFVLINHFGIVGAASAWSMEAIFGATLMFVAVRRAIGRKTNPIKGRWLAFGSSLLAIVCPVVLVEAVAGHVALRAAVTVACLGIYAVIVWVGVLSSDERSWLLSMIRIAPSA